MNAVEVERYVWTHMGAAPDGKTAKLLPDFGAGEGPPPDPPPPPPTDDMDQARAELAQVIALQDDARYVNRDADPDYAWTEIGEASRIAAIVRERLSPKVPPVEPPPEPPPPIDEDWSVLVSGAPGLAGRSKWLAGSTGCDIFVRRGTEVRAPHDCAVTFRQVAGGPIPIGEMLLVYPDGRAIRFRHVASRVGNSAQARRGQVVAIVWDDSMDTLVWPRGYPIPPDGFQHVDVSLATRVAYLNPQGGAGGDVDADIHIWGHGGIPGITLIQRTPGPPEGSVGTVHAASWARWASSE